MLEDPLPPIEPLQQLVGGTLSQPAPPQNVSTVEPYRAVVTELRQSGTEVTAIWHRHAFEFLGGVPKRVVTDNLKAAVTKTDWLGDEPILQLAYRECAEHYGFLIAPCRPRTPEHKGKVESGVHFLKRNFLGGRIPTTITVANKEVREWCLSTAGKRVHGTTKRSPLDLFEQVEKPLLKALPQASYDLASWKDLTLHRDCYIVFEGSFYSAPFRLIGHKLRVRGGSRKIRIYTQQYELVATHSKATQSGQRFTRPDHLPPHKLPGLQLERESVQAQANKIGTATGEVVKRLLEDSVLDRLPSAGRLVRLKNQAGVGEERLEAACKRALSFDEATYKTIKRILEQGLDQPQPDTAVSNSKEQLTATTQNHFRAQRVQPSSRFKRTAGELLGHLFSFGGGRGIKSRTSTTAKTVTLIWHACNARGSPTPG